MLDFTFAVSIQKKKIDLVVASVAELGFKGIAIRTEIYNQAKLLGLDICPKEVGPQLRLQYKDQPEGERLFIAMAPFTDSDGHLFLFRVSCDVGGNRWLSGNFGNASRVWVASDKWLFIHCKRPHS